ncbi:hypothetical protein [Streptomyces sp. C10]|uniref:hypothetical protein n=1 Tax=Streptomyces sp. C10 TaxID=531941 RepID=UPI003981811C
MIMRFHWYKNGYLVDSQDSPRACGPGTTKEFTLRSSDKHATWVNWEILRV